MNITNYLDSLKSNIYDSVDATLHPSTKYSCAILLSVYTEIMGGHLTGNMLKEWGHSQKNYDAFLKYMNQKHSEIIKFDVYKRVRVGLVHHYEPQGQYVIVLRDKITSQSGIELTDNGKIMIFNLREYFRDFKNGFEDYCDKIYGGDKKLIMNFRKSISSGFFPPQGGRVRTEYTNKKKRKNKKIFIDRSQEK